MGPRKQTRVVRSGLEEDIGEEDIEGLYEPPAQEHVVPDPEDLTRDLERGPPKRFGPDLVAAVSLDVVRPGRCADRDPAQLVLRLYDRVDSRSRGAERAQPQFSGTFAHERVRAAARHRSMSDAALQKILEKALAGLELTHDF